MTRAVKDPFKAIRYAVTAINGRFKLTESAKVSNNGERLFIKNWQTAKQSPDFSIFAHLQRYEWVLPHVQKLNCLDDGCGSGYGTHYLAENGIGTIIGIDLSDNAIEYANKHCKTEKCMFKQMDALNLEFEDKYFDVVISFDVLEHISEEKQVAFISEVARVLNDDGVAYIGCPNATVSVAHNKFHLKELSKKEFESLLQTSFKEVTIFGQDLLVNGIRQKQEWLKCILNASHFEGIITDEDCDLTYGLLAICHRAKLNSALKV